MAKLVLFEPVIPLRSVCGFYRFAFCKKSSLCRETVYKAYFMYNYTDAIRRVCEDICFRTPALKHIDMSRVAVSFSQTRNSSSYGVFASLTPLKFEGGKETMIKRGRIWKIQSLLREDGTQYLYILYVSVPRFMALKLSEKLETIVHELFHIGPDFDGDLRRFTGRCYAHGSSRKKYDLIVKRLLKEWLDMNPPPELWGFLQFDHRELKENFGAVCGLKVPPPKLIHCTGGKKVTFSE